MMSHVQPSHSRASMVGAVLITATVVGAFALSLGVEWSADRYTGPTKVTVDTSVFPHEDCEVWVSVVNGEATRSAPMCP